jgi:outer membrane protein TolC
MVVVKPQRLVRFGLLLVPVLGCCLYLGARAEEEQKLQPKKDRDRISEIKALRKEKCDTLAKLLEHLQAQYKEGLLDFGRVAQAERDFLKATVDLEDRPDKRLAALKKVLEAANGIAQLTKDRFKNGTCSEADVLQARAVLLDARIELLREELKSPPRR